MSLALEIGLFFIAHQEGAGRAPHTTQRRAPSARRTLGVRQVHARPYIYLFIYSFIHSFIYLFIYLFILYIIYIIYYILNISVTDNMICSP